MGLRLTRAFEAPTVDITIPQEGNKKDVEVRLPQLGYVPPKVVKHCDAVILDRVKAVQAERDRRNKAREPIPAADSTVQYPGELDVMDAMLAQIDPDAAAVIADLSLREREDIWKYWTEESKPVDLEKSEASSDSSDATE